MELLEKKLERTEKARAQEVSVVICVHILCSPLNLAAVCTHMLSVRLCDSCCIGLMAGCKPDGGAGALQRRCARPAEGEGCQDQQPGRGAGQQPSHAERQGCRVGRGTVPPLSQWLLSLHILLVHSSTVMHLDNCNMHNVVIATPCGRQM